MAKASPAEMPNLTWASSGRNLCRMGISAHPSLNAGKAELVDAEGCSLGAVTDVNGSVEVGDVALNGAFAENKSVGDFSVCLSLDNELEHLELPIGERLWVRRSV